MATTPPPIKQKDVKSDGYSGLGNRMDFISNIIYFVLVIVGMSFITLLFAYYQQSAVSYQGLHDQVLLQNQKIDNLAEQLKTKKLPLDRKGEFDYSNTRCTISAWIYS